MNADGRRNKKLRLLSITIMIMTAVIGLTACGGAEKVDDKKENVINEKEADERVANVDQLKPEELPKALLEGKYELIYKQFSPEFKGEVSQSEFEQMSKSFIAGVTSFKEEASFLLNELDQRIWVDPSGHKGLLVVFDEQGTILGMQIQELGAGLESDNRLTHTTFSLPFKEPMFVFWGGHNVLLNYHYAHEMQRYAYDLIQVENDRSYKGDPKLNESYYAFGKDILAPADGVVVSVVNNIPDNAPVGVMNEEEPAGNQVTIDHNGEYSILAHLKQGSVKVKVGESVKRGEVIGQLGNSGNSSEPHLHFQVSDGENLFESRSLAVKWENNLHPRRGEMINGEE